MPDMSIRFWVGGGAALVLAGCQGSCGAAPPAVETTTAPVPTRAGRIELGIVSGALPADVVERAVKGVVPTIGGCLAAANRPPFRFTTELAVEPSGTVRVRSVIWEDGTGREACIRDG